MNSTDIQEKVAKAVEMVKKNNALVAINYQYGND